MDFSFDGFLIGNSGSYFSDLHVYESFSDNTNSEVLDFPHKILKLSFTFISDSHNKY